MFLCYHLVSTFSFAGTKAAEYTALVINKSDRTIRRWRSSLIENDGDFLNWCMENINIVVCYGMMNTSKRKSLNMLEVML